MTVQILRPDGPTTGPAHRLSTPRAVLAGARIGVLDNQKPNAGLVMLSVARKLAARAGCPEPIALEKNAAKPAPLEVIEQLRKQVDLVITGSAD